MDSENLIELKEQGDWMTYEQVADELGIPYAAFRQAVSKFKAAQPCFRPTAKLGRRTLFSPQQVTEIQNFMSDRSFSLAPDTPAPSLSLDEVMARLNLTKSGVWYYRRRHGKLFPDLFLRTGEQARPQARFLVSQIEEFEAWLAAGKPEDADLHIADISNPPGTDLVVRYKNGVTVAIINDEEQRVTPEMPAEDAEKYVRQARDRLDTLRVK